MKKPTRSQRSESKSITSSEALSKIYRYCAYQERSHQEVKRKLFDYGLRSSQVDEIVAQLITDGFLNEERFAKAFAGGKFRMMKWGRLKIQRELENEGLTSKCIARGLAEINPQDYTKTLSALIKKKAAQIREINPFKMKSKVASFVIGKGYEPELVWGAISEIFD